ncbi:hypothetical protein MUN89_10895 [Halobacillus salinarum]|uniref:DUF4190 domain-containing protein n=1 Tax=Halobacillus salinarum TaxID=2932257 RepID=A0ABY4EDH7_9BACI|nr:DUF4190 domain-containing protein [Halobacillus salinarum]UOQ42503.1 hypothetical protein MUN89_10895 [Halobacillus salinarum]
MDDPKYPVENQDVEQAPEHGDEIEEVTEEEMRDEELEELEEDRDPEQPVYGDSYEEEFAQEATAVPISEPMQNEEQETTMDNNVNAGMGWLGLTVAVLSFFFAPIIMGAAGIILGIVAKRRNADTLGNMAIIVSVISILFSLFFAPFYNFF